MNNIPSTFYFFITFDSLDNKAQYFKQCISTINLSNFSMIILHCHFLWLRYFGFCQSVEIVFKDICLILLSLTFILIPKLLYLS